MYWTLEGTTEQVRETPSVSFDPSDVLRLSQLSADLPWLGGLDPYRDRRVTGADLSAARGDFNTVLTRYTSHFIETFAQSKGIQVHHLQRRAHLLSVVTDHLNRDPFYQLLKTVVTLLETAEERGLSVQVFGT